MCDYSLDFVASRPARVGEFGVQDDYTTKMLRGVRGPGALALI